MAIEPKLNDWREKALMFEQQINQILVGQQAAIRTILLAVFARGHVLLEGHVGVGKTTLLRAIAQGLGGSYARIEGTIDLLPTDLVYYTHIDNDGRPRVDPGPLLKQGERLSTFFFNEINRARPQVHSLLLRAMAERSINAFNKDNVLPHLQVFADRNRVEKEETFDLPAAARDRFMMEITIETPRDDKVLEDLMFNPRYHNTDQLIGNMASNGIPYYQLNEFSDFLQKTIQTSQKLQDYALALWKATKNPQQFGIRMSDVDMTDLLSAGASPRGMSYLIRCAKVLAWMDNRDFVLPEDIQAIFYPCMVHRLFLNSLYAYRKEQLIPELISGVLNQVAAP